MPNFKEKSELPAKSVKRRLKEITSTKLGMAHINVASESFRAAYTLMYFALMKKAAKIADEHALMEKKLVVEKEHIAKAEAEILQQMKPRVRQQRIDDIFTPLRRF